MNKLIIVLLISTVVFLLSCGDKNEPCQDCVNNDLKSEVKDLYVSIPYSGNSTPFLLSRDSITLETTGYLVCNSEAFQDDVEPDKVLKISGRTLIACESQENEFIKVDDFEIVDYCYDPLPMSNGTYDLFNEWVIYSIETPDTILYTPCELVITPTFIFQEGGGNVSNGSFPNTYSKNTEQNDYSGSYLVVEDSLFMRPETFSFSYSLNTTAVLFWEKEISNIMESPHDTTVVLFKINTNVLTLSHPSNSSSMKLYVK